MSETMLDEVRRLFDENSYQKTIDACNEILKSDLNNSSALGYKARSLYLLNEHEEALKIVNNAIMLYPDYYGFLRIKADVLMDMEKYDDAIECFEEIFEIGVDDETALAFIKMDYELCFSFKVDLLIEKEKYVDAWKCYNHLLEIKSEDLKRSKAIDRFKRHVAKNTSKAKSRHYYVRITSDAEKVKLIDFLDENGFKSDDSQGLVFVIDVVDKTYNSISADEAGFDDIISQSKFYDKVNYYPRDKIVYRQLHDECGNLVYEGNTLHYAPYGFGVAYFANGNIYREGIFDIKGIVQGKEYYPSGNLRFEGKWALTTGYGPNAPYDGNAYDEDGELIFSGKFEIKRGGVGWPMIQKPKGFPLEQKDRPKIDYYR